MKITPLDIQQMVFKVGFRGYEKEEVNRFLEELAQTVESLNRDNAVQREKIVLLEQQLAELMVETRDQLATIYASGEPTEQMRTAKSAELARLRDSMATLGLASAGDLNNARLAAVATYHRCVPALTALLAQHNGNLPDYYAAIRALAHDSAARSTLCPGDRR